MDGYEIPVYRALTQSVLLGGVPRQFAILNWTLAAGLGFGLQSWYAVPICIILHLAAAETTKRDPHFMECLRRHLFHKSYYST